MPVVGLTYRARRAPGSCCGLVYQPHDIPSAVAKPFSAAAALGPVAAVCSEWFHKSARAVGAREGDEEHSFGRSRLQLASLPESVARHLDVCRRLNLGDRLSTATQSFRAGLVSRSVVADSGADYLAKAARQFASWLQILRLSRTDIPVCPFQQPNVSNEGDRQACLSYVGLKTSTQDLYVLNTPWYTLRAQRVEQVGRSLLESNCSNPSISDYI